MDSVTPADQGYLREALAEGRKGLGTTSPNPPVGAVIVRDGRILGRGWHRRAGEPHQLDRLRNARVGGHAAHLEQLIDTQPQYVQHVGLERAEALHQPEPVRLVALHHLGCQQHRPGRTGPRQQGQTIDGPHVDRQAETSRRDAEAGRGRGDPQVAGDGELGARPQGGAVRGRDRDEGGHAQAVEHRPEQGREGLVLDARQVGAGAEVAVRPGQHECTDIVVAPVQRSDQGIERLVVDGVAPLGAIDGHDGDVPAGLGVDHGGARYRRCPPGSEPGARSASAERAPNITARRIVRSPRERVHRNTRTDP